jgi:hypothetical protein
MRLRVLILPVGIADDEHGRDLPFVFVLDEVDPDAGPRLAAANDAAREIPGCRGILCFRDTVEMPE